MNASGRDAIATDIVLEIVLGNGVRHGYDRAFAHGVSKTVGEGSGTGDGGHVEDNACTVGLHVRDARLDAVEDAVDVDAENTVEVLFAGGFDGADVGDAGVVDEDRDFVLSEDLLKNLVDLLVVGNIAGVYGGVSASVGDFLGGELGALGIIVDNANGGAVRGESVGDGLADAAATSGDDGDFAVKTEIAVGFARGSQMRASFAPNGSWFGIRSLP